MAAGSSHRRHRVEAARLALSGRTRDSRPERAYAAAREQTLFDESGGRSGAGEAASEARFGQGASPQANAERLSADAA
jgi:hypothetical protein